MFPLSDNQTKRSLPLVIWTLIGLNVLIFLWDRQFHPFAANLTFADLSMRPREVVMAIRGRGDSFPLVTLFTSMFLHGNWGHLLGNMVFLFVFGPAIEEAVGSARFALYYLTWGFFAAGAQIWVDSNSIVPVLGASGAIGGVLGAYLLLFPTSKIEIIIPLLGFLAFETSAWILLGLWFLFQIAWPQEGVANWAHVGGFLAGMVTVLILGGRSKILRGREEEFDF